MYWNPAPGDRVKTIITKDKEHEIIYLNGDHAIETTVSNEFLTLTGEWLPWPHQIIDFLSNRRNYSRELVLRKLVELDARHREVDFDTLCQIFLKELEAESANNFSSGG